jgi:predicted flavoprotein YhiN
MPPVTPAGPRTVFALTEHQVIAAGGVSQPKVHSEHETVEAAIAARTALYQTRPELMGCTTIVAVLKK